MRAIVTCDIHVKRDRLHLHQKLLRHISKLAIQHACPYVICIGDMVDEKQGVAAEQLCMIYDELEWSKSKGALWWWIRGNHEIGIKSRPHVTPMNLFREVCLAVVQPQVLSFPQDCEIAMLPWYRELEFKQAAHRLGKDMRGRDGQSKKILMAHIGLDEGRPSASNMYVRQEVSLRDLQPQHYDLVLLGDYHRYQVLATTPHTQYCGCPISHAYGDIGDQGVWLLDTGLNEFRQLPFERGLFPQHRVWDVQDPLNSSLQGYSPQDHNRITVPAGQKELYAQLYPTALIQTSGSIQLDVSDRRLEKMQDKSPVSVWQRVCQNKGIDFQTQALGQEILGEVAARQWLD